MKKVNLKCLAISLLASLFVMSASAQDVFKLNEGNSKLLITGTSTIHDWEMEAENFNGEISLKKDDTGTLNFRNIEFTCSAKAVKSDNRIMDNKAHNALKEKKYPEITFKLEGPEKGSTSGDTTSVKGMLTIAGKTREVNVSGKFDLKSDDRFTVRGEVPIKLSDFDVEPPTAMLGALKTGNEIVIKYNFEFDKDSKELTRNN